jgi:hypothetical protein
VGGARSAIAILAALPPSPLPAPTTVLKVGPRYAVRVHARPGGKLLTGVLPRREQLADGSRG